VTSANVDVTSSTLVGDLMGGRGMRERSVAIAAAMTGVLLGVGGCSGGADGTDGAVTEEVSEQRYPDVLEAELEPSGDGWRLSATISSPYDAPDRYADAFRVLTPDGEELGVRKLLHDHVDEQPFTRSLEGLDIPDDISEVIIEGRDQRHGWGGGTVRLPVPGR
jgi:hypothetical protein